MKQKFFKTCALVVLLLTTSLTFYSCTEELHSETLEVNSEVKITDIVEILLKRGYKIEDIQEHEKFYVVEDDLVFSKNIKDYEDSDNSRTHYQYENLIGSSYFGPGNKIYVFSEIADAGGVDIHNPLNNNLGNNWHEATKDAIEGWNNIEGSCVTFELTNDPNQAHITIKDGIEKNLQSDFFGNAGEPTSSNDPFHTIWINLQYPMSESILNGPVVLDATALHEKRNIIAHELGHTIGFGHTDANLYLEEINNTGPTSDPGSIMVRPAEEIIDNANTDFFSFRDKVAIKELYGTCTDVPNGQIIGPDQINLNSLPTEYTWSGSGSVTWSVSFGSVLAIQGSVSGTSVDITGNAVGVGTLTAQPNGGGVAATKQVTVVGSGGRSGISGPNRFCSGTSAVYMWTGDGTVTWSGSSGLTLSSPTGTSVTVSSNGSSSETLTATPVGGGSIENKSIQVSTGPYPTSIPGPYIVAPTTLFTGPFNAQPFYAYDMHKMTHYNTLSWKIISYNFQNAGQYFQISTTGPTAKSATVTATQFAPDGEYFMQLKIEDDCGYYTIEKSFQVSGTPVIFGGG